jgi:hypothetical protein
VAPHIANEGIIHHVRPAAAVWRVPNQHNCCAVSPSPSPQPHSLPTRPTQVHRNITRVCDAACVTTDLPFEVKSLQDLCSRGHIRDVYSKCAMLTS